MKRKRKIIFSILAIVFLGGIFVVVFPLSLRRLERAWEKVFQQGSSQTEKITEPIILPEDTGQLTDALAVFPRLHGIFFNPLFNTTACHQALAAFDVIRTGVVDESNEAALAGAKKKNPQVKIFTHMSLRYIEADWFGFGTTHPRHAIVEQTSPRHFAYTPLFMLQKSVKDATEDTFEFSATDIRALQSLGVKGMDDMGLDRWVKKYEHEPYYFQFFDNDADARGGTVEIMAIQKLWTEGEKGFIQASHRRTEREKETRAIFGTPQSYSAGMRAGVLSSTNAEFGALVFLTNLYCMDGRGEFCQEVNHERSFIDVAVDYVVEQQLSRKKDGIFLVDGTTLDADDEDALKAYSYRFAGASQESYQLDMDGNGVVDSVQTVNAKLPPLYALYAEQLKKQTAAAGRPDFFLLLNGRFAEKVNGEAIKHPNFDGREFEDLNGGFNEPTVQSALKQYHALFQGLVGAKEPVVTVSSRDRKATARGEINLREHRATMAATLIFGNGYYGAMGNYTTILPQCFSSKEPETWMDEFSVDSQGVSSTYEDYSGNSKEEFVQWLGKATGSVEVLDEKTLTYFRRFENGAAVFSGKGGTVSLPGPFNHLCGTDPVNDCRKNATSISLEPFDGIVLFDSIE